MVVVVVVVDGLAARKAHPVELEVAGEKQQEAGVQHIICGARCN